MLLGLPDPHQNPLVTNMDPAPDSAPDPAQDPASDPAPILPSSSKNSKKTLDFFCYVTLPKLDKNQV
jgi:hypothetical protein